VRPAEELVSGDVRLRRWRVADVGELHRAINESLPHLRPWMPWAAGDYDHAAAAAFLARCEDSWNSGEAYSYAIIAGELAGACGLERRIEPDGLEIGYWLRPRHTGRGLATLATAALVEQAFALPGIERVQIWHDAANTASSGIPRRLGFTEIARRTPPRDPLAPGEVGIDVVWQFTRAATGAGQAVSPGASQR